MEALSLDKAFVALKDRHMEDSPFLQKKQGGKTATQKKEAGETSGMLYFADLIGGCFAGVLGGVLLLPVIGIAGTCLMLTLLKSSSLVLLAITKILRKKA